MGNLDRAAACALLALATLARGTAAAQEHVVLRSDVLLYGDNTEFRNPFREGETIFGAAVRLSGDLALNPRVALSLGVLTNQRFGSSDAFELVRPVVALTMTGARSTFVFGTFAAPSANAPMGPDRMGPHRLLPPLQRETLAFDRPYEAGLQWTFTAAALRHEAWLEWQRLNTAEHRERLDAGLNVEFTARHIVTLPVQLHVVHQGGQLFASGPVADSVAAAGGVRLERGRGAGVPAGPALGVRDSGTATWSLETLALVSRYVPDRAIPALSRDGVAFFGRAAVERDGWRAHLVMWRGRNFIKDEGDPNYQSIGRTGERYRGTRDYAEIGGSRRFQLAPTASLEVSARFHRIERYYEYSYRVTSTVNVSKRVH